MQIAVIDLGIGNLRSVHQALRAVAPDADVQLSSDPQLISEADKVVLPGQGAVGTWFKALDERKLRSTLDHCLKTKPLLGICVGMQALFDYCEEDGGQAGLGIFDGKVRHFKHFHSADCAERLKIPQMGWNQVQQTQDHALWQGIDDEAHFYFVHSFCANSDNANQIQGSANFGHEFIAAAAADNVFAVQFHPEKSHNDGLQLLKNFTQWNP